MQLQKLLEVVIKCHFLYSIIILSVVFQNAASAATTRNQVLDLFISTVKNHKNVPNLIECLEAASRYASVIKRAEESGKKCRTQAVWIGLER